MKLTHLLKALSIALVLASGGSLANGAPQASPSPRPTRDWVTHPAVVQVNTPRSTLVYAIGDAHADPERLIGLLNAAGIIAPKTPTNVEPTALKWAAGYSILVVTGDMIEKGPTDGAGSLRVIALLRALQASAQGAGGQVILLMGNHEAEFLANWKGDFKRELEAKVKELEGQGKVEEAKAFKPRNVANCQGDLGSFLCNLPIAAKVNDSFFSHGGNTNGKNIAELSVIIQEAFASFQSLLTFTTDKKSILDARLNKQGCDGKPWFYDCGRETDPQKVLKRNADALGVYHLVQGHQPGDVKFPDEVRKEGYIFQKYRGLLVLLDSGMSRGAGNYSSGGALLITQTGTLTNPSILFDLGHVICANGDGAEIWNAIKRKESWSHLCPKQ